MASPESQNTAKNELETRLEEFEDYIRRQNEVEPKESLKRLGEIRQIIELADYKIGPEFWLTYARLFPLEGGIREWFIEGRSNIN